MASHLDLEEQEQLDQLKAFWKSYGNLITTVITLGLLAFAGWNGWNWWQREQAVKALICFWNSPEWSTKLAWVGSNPGNINGFLTDAMKERLDTIKFLDVTTSMLPNGIPFPVIPQAPEIMNIIVPDMMQNVLTGAMSIDDAAEDAAAKVNDLKANQ